MEVCYPFHAGMEGAGSAAVLATGAGETEGVS
jgi:hypothetical protein